LGTEPLANVFDLEQFAWCSIIEGGLMYFAIGAVGLLAGVFFTKFPELTEYLKFRAM
jgi:hypothetical protein